MPTIQPLPLPPSPKPTLISLPNELLLQIIPHLPLPQDLTSLRKTSIHFNTLFQTHETTLVKHILHLQPRITLLLFPTLLPIKTFSSLQILHTRLNLLSNLHATWQKITTTQTPELHWLHGRRWEGIFTAGVLLLYRLQDSGSYNYKVAIINGLSKTSLACLAFVLVASIKILRIWGPEPIQGEFCSGDVMQRSEVELATEEMLLGFGPGFLLAMLGVEGGGEWAVRALEKEFKGMMERQYPNVDGFAKPPTLTSCLRRAFAAKLGCHFRENGARMWGILSSTGYDEVDGEILVSIVRGEEIQGGLKRIF